MSQRGRTGWRRWVVRGAVCVVLGVVTTVGVAWGSAWRRGDSTKFSSWSWTDPYVCIVREGWGTTEIRWLGGAMDESKAVLLATMKYDQEHTYGRWPIRFPPDAATFRVERRFQPRTDIRTAGWQDCRVETEYGWPLRALWLWQDEQFGSVHGAIPPWDDSVAARQRFPGQSWGGLPLLPKWSGLVANTCFYALCWAGFLIASPLVRVFRHRRSRCRGHCPMCGYDLVHKLDAGCPECGWNRA